MRLLLMILVLSLPVCLSALEATKEQIAIINQFIRGVFNEDFAEIEKSSDRQVAREFQKYFWVKKTIAAVNKVSVPPTKWNGSIKIMSGKRDQVMSVQYRVVDIDVTLFTVKIDDKEFVIGLDDATKVAVFHDSEVAEKKEEKPKDDPKK